MTCIPATLSFSLLLSLNLLATPILVDRSAQLIFPATLNDLSFKYVHAYDEPGLGYSLRYMKGDAYTFDIYVYDNGQSAIPDGIESELLKKESRNTAQAVKMAEDRGLYKNVRRANKTTTPRSWGYPFLKQTYQFSEVRHIGSEHPTDRLSESYLSGYHHHFIKVRYTYDAKERSTAKKYAETLLRGLIQLIEAPPTEKQMARAALTVMNEANHDSYEAQLARQSVLQYAMETEDFSISIHASLFPWFKSDKKQPATMQLFTTFLIGAARHCVINNAKEGGEFEGFISMLNEYQRLLKTEQIEVIPEFDAWLKKTDRKALFQTLTAPKPEKDYDWPYPSGMRIAMVNGNNDHANRWLERDGKLLSSKGNTVAVFSFDGGHQSAPPKSRSKALEWLINENRAYDVPQSKTLKDVSGAPSE